MTGLTDSTVAASVVGRGATTSYPLCLLAMECSAQLEARGVDLSLEWVPRETNAEADALSNLVLGGFDSALRVDLDPARLPFLVLPQLLDSAEAWQRLGALLADLATSAWLPGGGSLGWGGGSGGGGQASHRGGACH